MSTDLHGRVALVTGAAQGMGAAHARRLAAAGATVVVNDLGDSARLQALADEIGGLTAAGDVSDAAECVRIATEVVTRAGRLDILVANHAYMTMAPLLDHDDADWWKVVDTNLGGTFFLIQAVLPHMRAAGAGRIVVITSEWGHRMAGGQRLHGGQVRSDLTGENPGPRTGGRAHHRQRRRPGVTDTPSCRWTPTPPGWGSTRSTGATPKPFRCAASALPTRSPPPSSSCPTSGWKPWWDR